MGTPTYPTDLTEAQWQLLQPHLPRPKKQPGGAGRPPADRRAVVNAILYVNKTGCQWRMLPKAYGNWNTVYHYFNAWSRTGVWAQVLARLHGRARTRQGRAAEPSAGCVDSQSVRMASQAGTKGYDGGKGVNGRKRHLLVDTLGWILAVVVTAANVADEHGLRQLLGRYFAPGVRRLRRLWADGAYAGQPLQSWVGQLKRTYKVVLDVVAKSLNGFHVVKRRWVVERTFAWLLNFRRLVKDYEVLTRNSEALIQVAMIYLLIRRLA